MKLNQRGFITIPEVLVVVILSAFFVTLILNFGIDYWRNSYIQQSDQDTFSTRLNAADFIRDSVGQSSGLINQNSIIDLHPNNPDTAQGSGNFWIPIHAIPSTINVGAANTTTPLLYYRKYSVDNTNNIVLNGAQPYEDEFVLYLNGSTKQLLIRTLANSAATNNKLKTSCPANFVTASCPADKVIAGDVASIATRYFSRTGNLIDWTSIYNSTTSSYAGPDYTSVDVLEVTLNITKKPYFQKTNATQNSTIIRIALRNT